jgi:hypothetical protein
MKETNIINKQNEVTNNSGTKDPLTAIVNQKYNQRRDLI